MVWRCLLRGSCGSMRKCWLVEGLVLPIVLSKEKSVRWHGTTKTYSLKVRKKEVKLAFYYLLYLVAVNLYFVLFSLIF